MLHPGHHHADIAAAASSFSSSLNVSFRLRQEMYFAICAMEEAEFLEPSIASLLRSWVIHPTSHVSRFEELRFVYVIHQPPYFSPPYFSPLKQHVCESLQTLASRLAEVALLPPKTTVTTTATTTGAPTKMAASG
jgi:hypothetical protein